MKYTSGTFLNRSQIFGAFVIVVLLMSLFDFAGEFMAGQTLTDMLDDALMLFLSAAMLLFFCADYYKQQRSLKELKTQLESVRGKLDRNDRHIGDQYRTVIQKQFDAWQLTPAEQEIALTLIKGLSFREVAALRQTSQKTARQHATNVYRKAGLSGRHELAGWFFEDLFNPVAET